ncbi:hypothetical protein [Ulvibacterium sp.]|uniref:hypothetical protein n=1 Tax=Ulvibacterium sp. TaxID=2665914 RepID=UPI003BAB48AB
MKIKENKKSNKYTLLALGAIMVCLLVASSFLNRKDTGDVDDVRNKGIAKNNDELRLNTPTKIRNNVTIQKIVQEDIGLIQKDSNCSVYITDFRGAPNLIYVYKGELRGRELTDRIFAHFFLKDNSKLPPKQRYVNLGVDFFPIEFEIEEETYFYSKMVLVDNFLEFDNVDYLNTGRYQQGVGNSYSLSKLKIDPKGLSRNFNDLETFVIHFKEKEFNTIKEKRKRALKSTVLTTSDEDFVKAKISMAQDESLKEVDIRLKGDWVDHLKDEKKWSFRIKMKDESTMFGMRKFSIQHPKTRNFLWEWLFNKVVKDNDIIGLRYDFLNTIIKVESGESIRNIDLGIMAFEESFDKILIENNERREGLILSFNESYMWSERNKSYNLNLPNSTWEREEDEPRIRVFNENKVLSTPHLLKQFNTAKGLIYELKKGNLKISEVFNIDRLTFFVALSNLFGARHGLAWHNIRFYYNPITSKFEPISFDSNSGNKLEYLTNYVYSDTDNLYEQKLIENLKLVSNQDFIQRIINKYGSELDDLLLNLGTEFNTNLDFSILEYNSNFIKKQLSPAVSIITSVKDFDEARMVLDVRNLSKNFSISIKGLRKKGGKTLSKRVHNGSIGPNETREIHVELEESFINAFVSKKNKKGVFRYPKDLEKVKVVHAIPGMDYEILGDIVPFYEFDPTFLKRHEASKHTATHEFVLKNETTKTVLLKKGKYNAKNDIVIPSGYKVVIEPGFNLDIMNGASFISYSTINGIGTKQDPIRFYSSDSSGKGVFVSGTDETSHLEYCYFTNLSNPGNDLWELSGAVNFHEADVRIANSIFEQNRCEDGLNIIRSNFSVDASRFKNTFSDAFDGDFVNGKVTNSSFINSGNDGIDVSGSTLTIENVTIENSSDKAVSAGEASKISGSGVKIVGGEIGLVSKDLSKVVLDSVNIDGTRLGFAVFQKKSEFGPGSIEVTNLTLLRKEQDYLVENNSRLILNDTLAITVSNKVIDKMYGKQYGKSTR